MQITVNIVLSVSGLILARIHARYYLTAHIEGWNWKHLFLLFYSIVLRSLLFYPVMYCIISLSFIIYKLT